MPRRRLYHHNANSLQVSFWRAMGVVNILTDLALIGFPMHVVITLQMSTTKKITILTFFGARSLYAPPPLPPPHNNSTISPPPETS